MPDTIKVNFESYLNNNPKFLEFVFVQVILSDTKFQNRMLGYGKDMNAGAEAFGAFTTSKNTKMTDQQVADYAGSIQSTKKMLIDSNIQLSTLPDKVKIALLEDYISTNVMGYPVKVELDKNLRAAKISPIKENNAQMLVKNFIEARGSSGNKVVNRQTNDTPSKQDDLPLKNSVEFFNRKIFFTEHSDPLLASTINYLVANNPSYKKMLIDQSAITNKFEKPLIDFQNSNSFTMTAQQRESLKVVTEAMKVIAITTQAEIVRLSPQAKESIVTTYAADIVNNGGKVTLTLPNYNNKILGYLPKTNQNTKLIVNALLSLQQKNKTMKQVKM